MQTSAKTKAKEFWKRYNQGMNGSEYDIHILEKLLLEHERDTRYTAIDILHSLEDEENNNHAFEIINRNKAIQFIHNLKVGN